ncbi:MAG: tripartite tricarboxylate transporter substrate binding protein [Rubrivivax sp.]|nr:tripartite tricarboxylate transporter substrate binding protein [Rubrivivax sp.]
MQRRHLNLALAAAALAPATALRAQTWPDKPVKFVLSQPAGSGPDNVARLITDRLARLWGQSVVVDNKPGGQNTIGALAAARSPADGSSFYFATTAALVTNTYLFKQLPYDAQKDFTPVAFVARSPFGVLVDANSPLRSMQDLVQRARANPGQMSLGNEGPRTFSGMISRLLAARLKLEFNQIPYASVGVSVQNTLGGQVEAIVADLASTAALVRSGRLRLLAVTSLQRVPGFESVPALTETIPGFEMVGWFALVAPAGTPTAVLQRVNRDMNAVLAERDLADRIAAIGPLADPSMSVEQVGAFLAAEHQRWGAATREIGMLPE